MMKKAFTLRLILLVILSLGVLTVAQVTFAQDDDDPVATEEVEDDEAEEADDEDAAEADDDTDAESEADDEEAEEADDEDNESAEADDEDADDENEDADTGDLALIFGGVILVILVLGVFAFVLLGRQRN